LKWYLKVFLNIGLYFFNTIKYTGKAPRIMPTITDKFLNYSVNQTKAYIVEVPLKNMALELTVLPGVFPPVSPFSYDSIILAQANDTKPGEHVLDLGTGCGIQAIVSGLRGAGRVVATDKSARAAGNCMLNARKHGLDSVIKAYQGNLFDHVRGRFDLVIANLPFVNRPASEYYEHWVFDQGYRTHSEFFAKARNYMKQDGRILMAFSDIGDVTYMENMASQNGLEIISKVTREHLNQEWYVYNMR